MEDDAYVWPTMVALAACLCEQIELRELPKPCYCGVLAGSTVSLDYCGPGPDGTCNGSCGGQAWVRPVDIFPSTVFPNRDAVASNCNSPLAARLEVGIARCVPQGTNSAINGYVPPSKEDLEQAARLQMADMSAIYAAIRCCMGADENLDYFVEAYTPLVPQGGCGGGAFTVVIRKM